VAFIPGKVRPKKIIMPSELTGSERRSRLSGPTITYRAANFSAAADKEGIPVDQELKELTRTEQREVLIDLIRQGKSDEEIGEAFDLSQWQVRNLRYRLGLKKDRGGNLYVEPPVGGSAHQVGMEAGQAGAGPELQEGLVLSLRGQYQAVELSRRLEALRALVMSDASNKHYEVVLELLEVENEEAEQSEEAAEQGAADN
jgi:hypothetical protein